MHRPARAVRVRDTFAASAYALYVGTCYEGDAVDTAEFSSLDGSANFGQVCNHCFLGRGVAARNFQG